MGEGGSAVPVTARRATGTPEAGRGTWTVQGGAWGRAVVPPGRRHPDGTGVGGTPPPLPKRVPQLPPPPFGVSVSPGGSSLFEPSSGSRSKPAHDDLGSSTGTRWSLRPAVEARPSTVLGGTGSDVFGAAGSGSPKDVWGLSAASEQAWTRVDRERPAQPAPGPVAADRPAA